MNKPYFCRNFFLTNWRHKRLKKRIDLLLFHGEHFYEFLENEMYQSYFWYQNKCNFVGNTFQLMRHLYSLGKFYVLASDIIARDIHPLKIYMI